jgi:hypothetical protein
MSEATYATVGTLPYADSTLPSLRRGTAIAHTFTDSGMDSPKEDSRVTTCRRRLVSAWLIIQAAQCQ